MCNLNYLKIEAIKLSLYQKDIIFSNYIIFGNKIKKIHKKKTSQM